MSHLTGLYGRSARASERDLLQRLTKETHMNEKRHTKETYEYKNLI